MTVGNFSTSSAINQLVRVSEAAIGGEVVNSVDARELHSFLEVGQDYSTWIKGRIEQYGFTQDIDFIQFHNFVESNSKARVEYALSLDMAKELSMVEKNDKGRAARKYFIECERVSRRVKAPAQIPETVQCQLMGAETIARMLNYSDASKIDIVSRVYKANNISSSFLPEYVEKARVVFSATELLKKNNLPINVRVFNALMVVAGYLEEKERPSSKGAKTFKALTTKGLKFGQKDVSPQNRLEVQPHYYEDTFNELYNELTA